MEAVGALNPYDVLMGKGNEIPHYIGNQRYRDLVEMRKQEYNANRKHKRKTAIASELVDHIQSLGGRFLRREDSNSANSAIEDGQWCVVPRSVALEKCKQSLRQRKKDKKREASQVELEGANEEYAARLRGLNLATQALVVPSAVPPAPIVTSLAPSLDVEALQVSAALASNLLPVLPPTLVGNALAACAVVEAQLLLFQTSPFALNMGLQGYIMYTHALTQLSAAIPQPEASFSENCGEVMASHHVTPASIENERQQDTQRQASLPEQAQNVVLVTAQMPRSIAADRHAGIVPSVAKEEEINTANGAQSCEAIDDDDVSDFVLSALALSDRPGFTEQQLAQEQASMTNEERAKVMADLFGRNCNVRPNKRARRDLDEDSIVFLVKQMRVEIERIPEAEKQALVKAEAKCQSNEFCDARLLQFLICEGMDVQLGARRFVNYWASRREVFGEEKYLLPMTLGGALRDDLVALEACPFCLLPDQDQSGRQLLYLDPSLHTREGYTSESLLRSVWYVIEITAQESTDIKGQAVQIGWFKNMTIWDYDRLYERMNQFETSAWPLRLGAMHACCSPSFLIRFIKPILFALNDKASRSRTLFHDGTNDDIINILSTFGIRPSVLPRAMGGNVQLNCREWIAERRAVELQKQEFG